MPNAGRIRKLTQVASARQPGLAVILEDVHDPHNAAAVFRTADAFGIQDVRLIFDREQPYDPRIIGKQSSSSANKWLDFRTYRSAAACVNALHRAGYTVAAAVADAAAEDITETDLTDSRLAVMFGNEHSGLSETACAISDRRLTIPMRGMVQSLNISVSAAIILYEITRQRLKRPGGYSPDPSAVRKCVRGFLRR